MLNPFKRHNPNPRTQSPGRVLVSGLWLLVLAVAACSREAKPPTGAAADPIPVGFYGALTGPTAAFGTASRNGAQLATDEINASGAVLGRPLRLIIEDTQGRAEEAASVVTKLITKDRVVAVIGENASSRSLAAAPICQANRVPMISPSATNPEVTRKGDYIFRVCFIDSYQGEAIALFVRENLKLQRVGILRDIKNDYSVGLAEFFEKSFAERGGRVVINQSYSEGDNDFRAQLNAIRRANPEALFVPGYYTDAGQIASQARDIGFTAPLIGGDGWDSPKVIEIGGKAVDGSYFANHYYLGDPRPHIASFVGRFRERFGQEPEAGAFLAYDAVHLVADAIRRSQSTDGTRIRDALAATNGLEGVSGTITFDENRNPIKPVAMIAIKDGKFDFAGWITP